MLIAKEPLEGIIKDLKKYSVIDTSNEITLWQAYSLTKALNSFWPRQYLSLYIYQLTQIVNLYEDGLYEDNIYFTDKDVQNILYRAKELLFYLNGLPYEILP